MSQRQPGQGSGQGKQAGEQPTSVASPISAAQRLRDIAVHLFNQQDLSLDHRRSIPAPDGSIPDGSADSSGNDFLSPDSSPSPGWQWGLRPHPQHVRVISSGWPALDRLLPAGGFRAGTLSEWFVENPGSSAGTLALWLAQQACDAHGSLVVVDPAAWFYPPAAAAWGIDLQRLIVIRPQHPDDALWATDQALRCEAVQAVWGWFDSLNDRWFRRFQLAAEQHGSLGMLLRPFRERGRPSWAELQLVARSRLTPGTELEGLSGTYVTDAHGLGPEAGPPESDDGASPSVRFASLPRLARRCLELELIRCRGPGRLGRVILDWDVRGGRLLPMSGRPLAQQEMNSDETSALHLVSQLADSTVSGGDATLAEQRGSAHRP